jgi:hypothetical protein
MRRYPNDSLAVSDSEHAALVEDSAELGSPITLTRSSCDSLSSPYPDRQTEPSELSAYGDPDAERRLSVSCEHENMSLSSGSTFPDTPGLHVRTKGNDLKSGFPYHPRLYDLQVRPDDRQRFSDQMTDATRFQSTDYAKIWVAAGSVALTGSVLTSAWTGRYATLYASQKVPLMIPKDCQPIDTRDESEDGSD